MAAKEVKFGVDARDRMLHGVEILANTVRVTSAKVATSCSKSPTAHLASPRMA